MTTLRAPAHHGFTAEQMWRDEIRLGGVQRCLLTARSPLFSSQTAPPSPCPPPAPPWPVLWATCGMAAYCFLWQAKLSADHFIFDVGRRNSSGGSLCMRVCAHACSRTRTVAHTCTHTGFKGTSSKKRKSFQMTKHRLLDECLLRLVFVFSPSPAQKSIIVSLFIFHSLSFFFFFVLVFIFLSVLDAVFLFV